MWLDLALLASFSVTLLIHQGWYHTVRVPLGIDTIQYSGVLYGIA